MGRLTQYERSVIVGVLAIVAIGALVKYLRDRGGIREESDSRQGALEHVEKSVAGTEEGKVFQGRPVGWPGAPVSKGLKRGPI